MIKDKELALLAESVTIYYYTYFVTFYEDRCSSPGFKSGPHPVHGKLCQVRDATWSGL